MYAERRTKVYDISSSSYKYFSINKMPKIYFTTFRLSTRSLEGRINQMSDRTCKDVCLGSDCYKLQVTAVAIDKSK